MIIESIITPIVSFLAGLIDLLPTLSVSEGLTNWLISFYQKIWSISLIFPLTPFILFISTILLFYSIKLTMKIISWVIRKIPVAGVS